MKILLFVLLIPVTLTAQRFTPNNSPVSSTSCEDRIFFKMYEFPAATEVQIYDLEASSDSGAIVIGEIRIAETNNFADALIAKYDRYGNIAWAVAVDGQWTQSLTDIQSLNDGNYVLTGAFGNNTGYRLLVLKITESGTLLWRKEYTILHPGETLGRNIIKEAPDGSFMMASQFRQGGLSFSDRLLLMKLSADGDILFSKFYTPANPVTTMQINDIVIKDGYSYVAGSNSFPAQNNLIGWVLKSSIATGDVSWSKTYDFNNGPSVFFNIFPTSNNRLCLFGTDDINAKDTNIVYLLDTAGSCLSSKYFQFNYGNPGQGLAATLGANGDIIFAKWFYRTPFNNTTLSLSRINPINGIIYSRDFPDINLGLRVLQTRVGEDNSIYVIGNKYVPDGKFLPYLARFSPDGFLGCNYVNIPATFGSGTTNSIDLPVSVMNKTYPFFGSGTMNPVVYVPVDSLCVAINRCDTVKIHGQNLICDIQQTYEFTAYRNPECNVAVNWQISPTAIQSFQQINDTTLQLRFNQSWQGYLYAKIEYPCGIFIDSMLLTVLNSPGQVNLGPDEYICPNNSRLLNAGAGYASYLWQDGSTDSTFTVTAAGLYWVEVYDTCNNTTYRDSILFTAAVPIPMDLGPNLQKCNSDTLTITAPPGFINYIWSPNYNISSVSGQIVNVYPAVDTVYSLAAESSPGCFSYDSIKVYALYSPPINLGEDVSFCSGDSLVLNAGPGFNSYTWNTGSNSPQITVKNTGLYYVSAMAANGCMSYDTLRVISVFSNPIVNLGPDATICENETKRLEAGGGFIRYNWSNGSSGTSLNVNTTGTYWVIVTDQNNCNGSDSITVTAVLPSPKQFLPPDTLLCNYSSIILRPVTAFTNYLWSTGSISSSIAISSPGNYWLQVQAANGCFGKDTIVVLPKQCLEGFYIPNAFTPNNDGKNDIIRPLLFGNVVKYEFQIYNRWGEIVFKTNDTQKGWNGATSGTAKDTHVYIWYCTYQFEGQVEQRKKGTFVLIR